MSGQVLGFTGSAHQDAFALLPWFVNGTLDAGEQAQVEQHMQACATCRRERAWLAQLAGAYGQSDVLVDADRAFARIAGRLADEVDDVRAPRRTAGAATSRRFAWLAGTRITWLRFAVALQLGVIVALGWVFITGVPAPGYRTLGAKHGTVREAGSLVIVFDPAATESDVRGILRRAGARIVDGPTAQGAYVLAVEDTPEALAAALERLRGERVVKLVAPLATERAR
jgi:anti-sigma factor RsiW